ncbi:class I SAM-dependent methyltransferase [Mycobacterium sp. TY815]|uniref:class I SAM-dependent methyltransferase n=1 Tax=Mycobacterium sp. TY815 TaxID=3050581 RepID=UPI002741470F|nr:methyltransferase domain-containing protein [Mycobacterium sp. TY815]MDP7703811.1 methyltransferase domain-containing protein [Mycobacterium sp. TY815]
MAVRDAVMAGIAKQLGHPSGLHGRFVGMLLNRGNRAFVNAAVQALQPRPATEVADVGFGGGVGLRFLLDSVGREGLVHGVEISETMLARAERRYRREIASGRLILQQGSLTKLPFDDGQLSGVITVNTIYFVAELDPAFTELARVVSRSGRIVVGLADPDAMAKMPTSRHGFHLRPVPEVVESLHRAGLAVDHRRIDRSHLPAHLLICTPARWL